LTGSRLLIDYDRKKRTVQNLIMLVWTCILKQAHTYQFFQH